MEKILFINACIRPDSRTYELAKHLLGFYSGDITELKLFEEKIQPLDKKGLEARENRKNNTDDNCPELKYAKQFKDADIIVVAAPFWDLSFPSVVKTYFEAVTVSGITFEYSQKGIPVGLCKAKKLFYVTTSGGFMGECTYGFGYIKALANGFYGIDDVRMLSAEGLDIFGADTEKIIYDAKKKIENERD